MSVISMKQLLEAGVHFGHQTRRWNPKMKLTMQYLILQSRVEQFFLLVQRSRHRMRSSRRLSVAVCTM